jgi:hypothetical protein
VALAVAFWIITAGIIGNRVRAGLVTSLFLILFFSFGHVVHGFVGARALALFSRLGLVGNVGLLLGVWAALFVLGSFVVLRKKMPEASLVQLFNLMALGALALPAWTILSYEVELTRPWPHSNGAGVLVPHTVSTQDPHPDIYYIILDGFGGKEVLADLYGIDLDPFYARMESDGFAVVPDSHSNYGQTALSLASSLNMTYLDFLTDQMGATSQSRRPLPRLIRWNRVREFLEDQGYRIIAFETGYRVTEWPDADLYLSTGRQPRTELDRLLYESSAMELWPGFPQVLLDAYGLQTADAHRERVRFVFDHLPTLASEPGPKFVFAHIISPHPPFLISRDGADLPTLYPFTLDDGDRFPGSLEEYVDGYRHQTDFVVSAVAAVVEEILASSSRSPVIILQGDHGPGSRFGWDSPSATDARERLSILNMIYLRGDASAEVYEGMSPVNTFRVVFNSVFNTNLALAPDRSYLSEWDQPYAWYPVLFNPEGPGPSDP